MTVDLPSPADRALEATIGQAIERGVFAGAAVAVIQGQEVRFSQVYGLANRFTRRPVCRQTLFDLASLTKPLATALAVLHLVQNRRLDLDQPLADVDAAFQGAEKSGLTIRHLLLHTAGFAAHRPYYRELMTVSPDQRRRRLRQQVWNDPLVYPPGQRTCYSDLGFIVLAWVVECAIGRTLDRFVEEKIYRPLGIAQLGFRSATLPVTPDNFAATAYCPWRRRLLQGIVHDDNAYAAGGIEGHAGLFGSLGAVTRLIQCLMQAYAHDDHPQVFEQTWLRRFLTPVPAVGRALGFDVPSSEGSSSGQYFSARSVGHLGYSGTSFWIDLQRLVAVILLTNRIHPHCTNQAIRQFRPRFHDGVFTCGILDQEGGMSS